MAATITVPARPPDAQSDAYLRWLRDLLWPDRVERFGGVLLVSSAPVPEHQQVVLWLSLWLGEWAARTGRAEPLPAVEVRLEPSGAPRPARQGAPDDGVPDLVLWDRDNPRVRRVPTGPTGAPAGYVEGAPDLVVEVRSPGTERYDLATKRRAYAGAGVPSYRLLDWRTRTALVLTAPAGGDYQQEAAVAWADLRWPPADQPGSERWGDHPLFPPR